MSDYLHFTTPIKPLSDGEGIRDVFVLTNPSLNMSEEKSLYGGEKEELLSQKTWKVLASTHSVAAENFPSLRVNLKPWEGLVLKSD